MRLKGSLFHLLTYWNTIAFFVDVYSNVWNFIFAIVSVKVITNLRSYLVDFSSCYCILYVLTVQFLNRAPQIMLSRIFLLLRLSFSFSYFLLLGVGLHPSC